MLINLLANRVRVETPVSDEFPESINNSDVVFIGTSLFAFGIPHQGQGLLEKKSSYTRLAWGRMTESETLDLLEKALEISEVRLVLIELNPFIRDFRDEVEIKSPVFLEPIREYSLKFKNDLNLIRRYQLSNKELQKSRFLVEPEIDHDTAFNWTNFLKLNPFQVRSPKQASRLSELLVIAKTRSVQVLFVLPPRSQVAADYLGKELLARLNKEAETFGEKFGVPVWNTGESWDNYLFVDHTHLNRKGREQFIAFLKMQAEQADVQ